MQINRRTDIELIVREWAETFSLPVMEVENFDGISDIAYDLIYEEMKELEIALKTRDFKEILDGMADTTWVIIRWLQEAGINFYDVFGIVATSNFSKLMSEKHYLENKEFYDTKYMVKKIVTEESYIFEGEHIINNDTKYIIYDKITNKVKKPITFREPDFSRYTNIF